MATPSQPNVLTRVREILSLWKRASEVPGITENYALLSAAQIQCVSDECHRRYLTESGFRGKRSPLLKEMMRFSFNAALPFFDEGSRRHIQFDPVHALTKIKMPVPTDRQVQSFQLSKFYREKLPMASFLVGTNESYFADLGSGKLKTLVPEKERLQTYMDLCREWHPKDAPGTREILRNYLNFQSEYTSAQIFEVTAHRSFAPRVLQWVVDAFLVDVIVSKWSFTEAMTSYPRELGSNPRNKRFTMQLKLLTQGQDLCRMMRRVMEYSDTGNGIQINALSKLRRPRTTGSDLNNEHTDQTEEPVATTSETRLHEEGEGENPDEEMVHDQEMRHDQEVLPNLHNTYTCVVGNALNGIVTLLESHDAETRQVAGTILSGFDALSEELSNIKSLLEKQMAINRDRFTRMEEMFKDFHGAVEQRIALLETSDSANKSRRMPSVAPTTSKRRSENLLGPSAEPNERQSRFASRKRARQED